MDSAKNVFFFFGVEEIVDGEFQHYVFKDPIFNGFGRNGN